MLFLFLEGSSLLVMLIILVGGLLPLPGEFHCCNGVELVGVASFSCDIFENCKGAYLIVESLAVDCNFINFNDPRCMSLGIIVSTLRFLKVGL